MGYVVAYSFTYTMVSAPFLRKVPIKRYQHLSTATHTSVVIYSLSWMHCITLERKHNMARGISKRTLATLVILGSLHNYIHVHCRATILITVLNLGLALGPKFSTCSWILNLGLNMLLKSLEPLQKLQEIVQSQLSSARGMSLLLKRT